MNTVMSMVHHANSFVQRQYERHSDAALAQRGPPTNSFSKRMSLANADSALSPKLRTHQASMVKPKKSLNPLREKHYQITRKITMVRREREPRRKHFNPNETGWTAIGSHSSVSGPGPEQGLDHFLSRGRYSTQDSGFAGPFLSTQQGSPRPPKNASKHVFNVHDASHQQNLSIFDETGAILEDLDATLINNRSQQDGPPLALHAPSAEIYDFSLLFPTRINKKQSTSTTHASTRRPPPDSSASPFQKRIVAPLTTDPSRAPACPPVSSQRQPGSIP